MKKSIAFLLSVCMFFSLQGRAENPTALSKAQAAADSWLLIADSGKYAQSWDHTAGIFQSAVTKAKWTSDLENVRLPLGSVKSRKLKSADFTRELPRAPEGEYVVIQYNSQFEHHANMVETVTSMQEPDGTWKVVGYFIKRGQ